MFPQGFLGTRADFLMDVVIVALVAVVPIVLYNWRLARRGKYGLHKTLQVSLALLLAVVVGLFEYNLRLQGGDFRSDPSERLCGLIHARLLDLFSHVLCDYHDHHLGDAYRHVAASIPEPADSGGLQPDSPALGSYRHDLDAGDRSDLAAGLCLRLRPLIIKIEGRSSSIRRGCHPSFPPRGQRCRGRC